ncbi:MAG: hypothetical protein NPIRA04_20450 [Nitrospirales bacterium]|nr:MAG: hypothetical protein NPIRA04_20450 [Nitrospirales bacterium]
MFQASHQSHEEHDHRQQQAKLIESVSQPLQVNKRTPMRKFVKRCIVGLAGLLAWTLSVHVVPVQLDAQQRTLFQCHSETTTQRIFQSMTDGVVTQMWNDGIVLSVTVSKAWMSLSTDSQEHLYLALGCLAREKQVVFQISPSYS